MSHFTIDKPRVNAVIHELTRRFPGVIVADIWETHAPLAIGVYDQLVAACADIDPSDLKAAIWVYTRQRRMYHVAVAAEGAMRLNLDGSVYGAVSPEHAVAARNSLAEIDQHREAKRVASKAANRAKSESAKSAPTKGHGNGHATPSSNTPPPPLAPLATDTQGRLTLAGLRQAGAARKAAA